MLSSSHLKQELGNAEHIPEPTSVITSVNRGMPEDWSMGGGRGRGIQMGVAHGNAEVCAYFIHGVFGVMQRPICRYDRLREKKSCARDMCSLISIFASSESAHCSSFVLSPVWRPMTMIMWCANKLKISSTFKLPVSS